MRRECDAARRAGGGTSVLLADGGAIWIGGSKLGEADCCARDGAFRPTDPTDARMVEANRLLRLKIMAADMRKSRQTAVARHSERGFTKALRPGEADVCSPRPTSSRVTTADGRSPGSRVMTLRRLPGAEIPQWPVTQISRLQLRGQPWRWDESAPRSLLISRGRTVVDLFGGDQSRCQLTARLRRGFSR